MYEHHHCTVSGSKVSHQSDFEEIFFDRLPEKAAPPDYESGFG